MDLLACDFTRPAAAVSELRSAWEALSSPNDIKEEFSLSIKDISQAHATLSAAFGIPAVDGGGELGPATKKVSLGPLVPVPFALEHTPDARAGPHHLPRGVGGWQRHYGRRRAGEDQGRD